MAVFTVTENTDAIVRVNGVAIDFQKAVQVGFGQQVIVEIEGTGSGSLPYDIQYNATGGAAWEFNESLGWDIMGTDGHNLHSTGFVDVGEVRQRIYAIYPEGTTPDDEPLPPPRKTGLAVLVGSLLAVGAIAAVAKFRK